MKKRIGMLLAVGLMAGAALGQTVIVPTACVLENARTNSAAAGPYLQNAPPTRWWNSAGIITNEVLIADGASIPATWPQHEYGYSLARLSRIRDTGETTTAGTATLTFALGGLVEVEGIVLWNGGEGSTDASDRGVQTAGISWSSNGVDFISSGETLTFAKGPQDADLITLTPIDADPQYLTTSLPGVTHIRMEVANFVAHPIIMFSEIRMIGTRASDLYYVSGTPVDWNSASAWTDGNPATINRNYFVTNGVVLNTPASTETFAGNSLALEPAQRMELLVSSTDVITVDNLVLNAAEVAANAAGSGEAQINGNINVSSSSMFSGTTRDLRILSRVNGGGAASVELDAPAQTIFIDNATNSLSGTWVVSDGTAEFASDGAVGSASIIVSNGTLSILGDWNGLSKGDSLTVIDSASAMVNLGTNSWTVDGLMVGSSNVLTGFTYDATQLSAIGAAVFTGSGTIQVGIPYVAPPAPELLHHWEFNGDATDSVGTNDGTLNGGAALQATGGFDDGGYASFSGEVGAYVSTGVTYDPNAAFSWAVWAKTSVAADDAIIVGNRRDGTTGGGGADFSPREFIKLQGIQTVFRPNNVPVNVDHTDLTAAWTHLAVVNDGAGNVTTYYNGVTNGAPTDLGNVFTAAAMPFFIGGDNTTRGTEFFNGDIDDVVIYNYAITASNVVDVMNGIYDFGGEVDLSNAITDYSFNPSGTSSLSFTGGVSSAYVIKSKATLPFGNFETVTPSAVTTGSLAGDVITTDGTGAATAEFTETASAQFYIVESAP